MSELLQILNFDDINIIEKTELASNITATATVIPLENDDGFTSSSYIKIGQGERAEIRQGQTLTDQNLTVSPAVTFAHIKGEQILRLRGNKIRLYRAPNTNSVPPSDSNYTLLTTLSIEADQPYSQYLDAEGGSEYWYKYTYYNEDTDEETSLGNSMAIRGGQIGQLVSVDDVRKEAGLEGNDFIDQTQISIRRDQAQDEVKSVLFSAGYTLPLIDSNGDEYIPPFIENVALLLAAGYILSRDYGATDTVKKEEGDAKIKLAQKRLEQIRKGEISVIDRYGQQMYKEASVAGWPDDTTKSASEDNAGGERMFTVKKIF
jgi:hypothetical protein